MSGYPLIHIKEKSKPNPYRGTDLQLSPPRETQALELRLERRWEARTPAVLTTGAAPSSQAGGFHRTLPFMMPEGGPFITSVAYMASASILRIDYNYRLSSIGGWFRLLRTRLVELTGSVFFYMSYAPFCDAFMLVDAVS